MVKQILAASPKADVRWQVRWRVILWVALRTGYSIGPSLDDIVSETGLTNEVVASILVRLTTIAHDLADHWQMAPVSPLKTKPLVAIRDCHVLPSPALFLTALQTLFETALKLTSAWEAYQTHRAHYGEERAAALFGRALPGAATYRNLKYRDGGRDGELDILVMFDRQLVLIEVKSGDFAGAARTGVESRVEDVLADLVSKADEQAERATDYIGSAPTVRFRDGTATVEVQRGDFDAAYRVAITLEQLGHVVNTAGAYLRQGKPDSPWTVSLDDLEVITDILTQPSAFLHYIKRRQSYLAHPHVKNADELGFLEGYLLTSLRDDPASLRGYTDVLLDASSTSIDTYENGKAKGQNPPRPEQKIPAEVKMLLDRLSEARPSGWLTASLMLLDLIPRHQRVLARAISRLIATGNVRGITSKDSSGLTTAKLRLDDPRLSGETGAGVELTVDRSLNPLELRFW
jgi:Holliday junction resolvase-like predicted endonuclease